MGNVELKMNQEQIGELEKMIAEMPFKFAQPLLAYLGKHVKQVEEVAEKEEG